jgi:hypothetical protein
MSSTTVTQNYLDRKTLPWETDSPALWSLWDMVEYPVKRLCEVVRKLEAHIVRLELEPNQTTDLPLSYKWPLAEMDLDWMAADRDSFGLDKNLMESAAKLQDDLMADSRITPEMLRRDLVTLRNFLINELDARKFAYLAPPKDKFFQSTNLLGELVHLRFPKANPDAQSAANCLAFELYTAAVFHLMRVAEHGLRAIAEEVNAVPMHRTTQIPITEADWQQIITAIRGKIEESHKDLKSDPKRRSKLRYYSDAADHCSWMKDIWRNSTAHAQAPYIESEAINALSRVSSFMEFLAKHLDPITGQKP